MRLLYAQLFPIIFQTIFWMLVATVTACVYATKWIIQGSMILYQHQQTKKKQQEMEAKLRSIKKEEI